LTAVVPSQAQNLQEREASLLKRCSKKKESLSLSAMTKCKCLVFCTFDRTCERSSGFGILVFLLGLINNIVMVLFCLKIAGNKFRLEKDKPVLPFRRKDGKRFSFY